MGTDRRSLAVVLLRMLLGAVVGALTLLLLLTLARTVAPQRYVGTVLLYAPTVHGDSSHGRRRLQVTLDEPGFMSSVVQSIDVSRTTAAELARSVEFEAAGPSAALTDLRAVAHDEQELADALNAIAVTLVQRRRDVATNKIGTQVDRLTARIERLRDRQAEIDRSLDDVSLPLWARASASALGALEADRFGLTVDPTHTRSNADSVRDQVAELDERIAQLRLGVGGEPSVMAATLESAIERAAIPGKIGHLLAARETLRAQRLEEADLRIVRSAAVAPMPPPLRRGLWAAVFGAAIGALVVLIQWIGRPAAKRHRDGPTLESHLHVRVIGCMASALVDYGDRKMRPLAQTHPQHLAVDAVRSLHVALTVIGAQREQAGPIVMANADQSQNAGHVLANLAMLAADRGERVLLIETAGGESVLSSLFTTGTRTTLSTIMDTDQFRAAGEAGEARGEGGRIRFVVADDDSLDPPVPGAFIQYFDQVYIRCHSVERATALLEVYGGGIGVLVGGEQLPIRQWQSARDAWRESDQPLDGLVHCGHRIDERLYARGGI